MSDVDDERVIVRGIVADVMRERGLRPSSPALARIPPQHRTRMLRGQTIPTARVLAYLPEALAIAILRRIRLRLRRGG